MVDCVTIAQSEWGSLGLAQVVERAWHRLNGPRVLSDIAQWQDATDYFNALTHWSQAGRVSFDTLTRGLAQLYSNVKPKRPRVRLMTIHAAKGLEWDTVMLVGLGKKNASDESQLLEWQSLSGEQGERGLLVAPFRSKEEGSSVASVIRLLNKKRAEAERKRLWYVAVTRAKRRLILVGRLRIDETTNEPQTIPAHTGCAILWPIIHKSFLENALRSQADVRARFAPSTVPSHPINPTGLYRVVEPINLKDLTSPSPYLVQRGVNAQTNTFDFEWVSPVSRAIGVLVHDIFERMGRGQWLLSTLNAIPESFIGQRLSELGVGLGAVSAATARVRRILAAVATDPKAQWIFNTHHQDSQFEWELMHKSVDGFEIARIDRSFIADDGTRYIIDYKTSDHEGRDLAGFLIQEKDRYRQQLERYGSWVQELEPQRPIKLALYFPVLTQWVDWDFTDH
jgi:ATP-dependent exoDNAse (exonuclease V) beta subunit